MDMTEVALYLAAVLAHKLVQKVSQQKILYQYIRSSLPNEV